ncbi:HAD family hydrolase [Thalassococcus sp. BH17M4-6]|uniref:HAD family hydrolase n=1 Tax=Thalassococcus sp. BH17M4-6 TaxID=3413148 RepID=UPI003BEC6692
MTQTAPPTFTAVIFDLDGTLLDTEAAAMRAGVLAFETLGIEIEEDFLHRLVGKDYDAGAQIIAAEFGDIDTDRLNTEWSATTSRLRQRDGVPLKPGAADLLAHLSDLGVPLALATSSHDQSATEKLQISGLDRYFPIVVTRDSVQRAKPAPDPYLLAADRLGHAPTACLVFEDSEPGAESAHTAGACVVQVPDILPTEGRFAHHVAETLMDGARWAGLLGR